MSSQKKAIYSGFANELQTISGKKKYPDYVLKYFEFPYSPFLDDENWVETYCPEETYGVAGPDVDVKKFDNKTHAQLLKFHVWCVNKWISVYQNHDDY